MDGAVGVSQKSLDEMIAHYGFKKPSVCIPRAIDIDHFANYVPDGDERHKVGIREDAFVLLFLGNFTKQKRPDRFIDIIHGLQKDLPQVHGLMVGDGPLKNDSVDQVEKLGLLGKITFAGYQQEVRPWISMSDILLLTSDTEGMPGVVLEAAAMKKTTVCGNVGGVSEFIENYNNGILITSQLINDYKDSIIEICYNRNKLNKLNLITEQKVRNFYNISLVYGSYKEYFDKLIKYIF
jgi:glycosyltransferase involved in cell wall biosynthesis